MRLRHPRLAAAAAGIALVAALAGCSGTTSDAAPADSAAPTEEAGTFAVDSDTLVFGAVPDQEAAQNLNQPLADYLGKITGKKIQFLQPTSYEALIEATAAGQVDVAFLSGFTYYIAADKLKADITPFAAAITEEGAEPGYSSVAIANPSAGVTDLKGFAGKNVCFVSESSTSGFLFPSSMLLNVGVQPAAPDITPVFAGSHDASALKVSQGTECSVGFAEDAVADPLIASGQLKEIHREVVPGAPLVVQNALPASLKKTIIDGLSNVTAQQMADAGIKDADSDWFKDWIFALAPIDDSYYDSIRQLCDLVTTAANCQG